MRAGTYPDGRDRDLLGDDLGNLVRDRLEHEREHSGAGQRLSIADELIRRLCLLALHFVSAHGADGLRGEPEMAHDRDLGIEDLLDRLESFPSALEFHGSGFALANEAAGVSYGVLRRDVIAHPWHVADYERVRLGPRYGRGVVHHDVDIHGQGVPVAEDDVGYRVSDEDDVGAGPICDNRGWVVVGGDHLDLCSALARANTRDGDLGHLLLLSPHRFGLGERMCSLSTVEPGVASAASEARWSPVPAVPFMTTLPNSSGFRDS